MAAAKVRTGGFEVGRLTLRNLVNGERVLARPEIFDIKSDFDALGRGRQSRGADTLAFQILELTVTGFAAARAWLSSAKARPDADKNSAARTKDLIMVLLMAG